MTEPTQRSAYVLSAVIAALAAIASAGGLLIDGSYRDNTLVKAAWYGNDLVTLVLGVPVLVAALWLSIRGSQRVASACHPERNLCTRASASSRGPCWNGN
jgi:hypothetical protein